MNFCIQLLYSMKKEKKEKEKNVWMDTVGFEPRPTTDNSFQKITCARKRSPYVRDIRRAGASYGLQT